MGDLWSDLFGSDEYKRQIRFRDPLEQLKDIKFILSKPKSRPRRKSGKDRSAIKAARKANVRRQSQ